MGRWHGGSQDRVTAVRRCKPHKRTKRAHGGQPASLSARQRRQQENKLICLFNSKVYARIVEMVQARQGKLLGHDRFDRQLIMLTPPLERGKEQFVIAWKVSGTKNAVARVKVLARTEIRNIQEWFANHSEPYQNDLEVLTWQDTPYPKRNFFKKTG